MKKALIFIISILSTLLICGLTPQVIAISVVAITAISWLRVAEKTKGKCLYSINSPKQHTPELIANALAECLKEIKRSKTQAKLVISNPGINPLTIKSAPDGEMTISDSHRTLTIENGELWIADHPIPLILKTGECSELTFSPTSDGRIHISSRERPHFGRLPLILTPVAVILIFLNFHSAAAVLTAPIIYCLLLRRFER